MEDRERGRSTVQNDDVSTQGDDSQGDSGSLENEIEVEEKGADVAPFFNAKDNSSKLITNEITEDIRQKLNPTFADEVDKTVEEYKLTKDEAISRLATLKLELALQHTNISINDFSDEQLEEIMSSIKQYGFSSNEVAEIANPKIPVWKMEQLKWLIDDMKKAEFGITSEKIKYLKDLDVDIAKFNVLKGYLVRDEISINQIDEFKENISSLAMNEFVGKLKNYAKKNNDEKVAIKVGTQFILSSRTDSFAICLEDTGRKVEVDGEIYNLNRGISFAESQKVDELIDSGKYTSLKIEDYSAIKENEIQEEIKQSSILDYTKQGTVVLDDKNLDLSIGTSAYMDNEEYTIIEVTINKGLGNSELILEPKRADNNYRPVIRFDNKEELFEKISFDRPKFLIGDVVQYKDKDYTVTRFDDMGNNLKTITIKDNMEYLGGMITGSEVIVYRLESDLLRMFNLQNKEDIEEKRNKR